MLDSQSDYYDRCGFRVPSIRVSVTGADQGATRYRRARRRTTNRKDRLPVFAANSNGEIELQRLSVL